MSINNTALYFDTLFWAIPDPVLILDKSFKAIKASTSFHELFDIKEPTIEGWPVYEILNPAQQLGAVKKMLTELIQHNTTSDNSNVIVNLKDISCRIKGKYIVDPISKIELIVLIFENITGEKEQQAQILAAEVKLQESESRFEAIVANKRELEQSKTFLSTILNTADFGIASYEPVYDNSGTVVDFRITYTNSDVPQNFGLTIEEVIDKTCREVYPGIFGNGIFDKMVKALRTGSPETYEVKVPANGQIIWLAATIEIVNGSLTITSKNITADKEAALHLEKMNKLLNAQNEDLASFTYIASHDLQEPLRKIRMFTSRIFELEKESFSPKAQDYFNTITGTVQRMQNLINDLLIYSKMDAETLLFEQTDLTEIIKEVAIAIDDELTENAALLEVSRLPIIDTIPTQIKQLFSNIILNAVKYRKPDVNPIIKITAETAVIDNEKFWKINVSDNGIGFDIQYKDKIFEVFQRLHGKQEYAGSGIGLAICKKIMQNHRGYISADSVQGVGSVFSVFFPL